MPFAASRLAFPREDKESDHTDRPQTRRYLGLRVDRANDHFSGHVGVLNFRVPVRKVDPLLPRGRPLKFSRRHERQDRRLHVFII